MGNLSQLRRATKLFTPKVTYSRSRTRTQRRAAALVEQAAQAQAHVATSGFAGLVDLSDMSSAERIARLMATPVRG